MGKLDLLYPYQSKAVKLADKNNKGVFCYPTGTGKTFIQSAILAKDIKENHNNHGIYVINCPRILLSYQLLKEVFSFLNSEKIDARYMYLHSGGSGDQKDLDEIREDNRCDDFYQKYAEIPSTTSTGGIYDMIQASKSQNKPLIILSTYHSADRIENALVDDDDKIRMVLNDEAHFLTQPQFHDVIDILESYRKYFFTATMMKTSSDCGMGMSNVDKYGELLDQMLPIEAIKKGKMLRPRLHYVMTDKVYKRGDLDTSIGSVIAESLEQHEYVLKGKINPKLLVSVDGTGTMAKFKESSEYQILRDMGYDIYMVASSEDIKNDINGDKYSRTDFINKMKECGGDPTKRMLVLHYDILSEGIDVPGLTGVMLLRGLSKSKFLQTYGRVARLNTEDRKKIENGNLSIDDLESYLKPYGWVIIPNIIEGDEDHKSEVGTIINELRSYGFNPHEDIIITNPDNGLGDDDDIEAMNKKKKRLSDLGELIEKVEAEYEEKTKADLKDKEIDMISKMSVIERFKYFKSIKK